LKVLNGFDSTQRRETMRNPSPATAAFTPCKNWDGSPLQGALQILAPQKKYQRPAASSTQKIAAFGVVPTLVRPFFGAVVVPGCSFASGRTYCATGRRSGILRAARSCWVRISWVDPQLAGAIFLRYLRCPKGMMIIGPILDVFLKGDDKQKHYIIL
jgi:hypothetical protein